MELIKKKIKKNENLAKYSWFNLGGSAEFFFKPNDKKELSEYLKLENNSITILGAGSNTLIRDGGVKGSVIKLGPKFSFINIINDNILHVGALTFDKKLSEFALENSISGFEFLSCIPGSVGGSIKMNSGCYGQQISTNLLSIEVMNKEGEITEIKKKKINFFYRGCDLPKNFIILSAKFNIVLSDKKIIKQKQENLIKKKKQDQPSQLKTCGSTFKNPNNLKAWQIIKNADCHKLSVGGAIISEKHNNFFINNGEATSKDIEDLIKMVQEKVFKHSGINLELEIKIIGFNS